MKKIKIGISLVVFVLAFHSAVFAYSCGGCSAGGDKEGTEGGEVQTETTQDE